MAALVGPSRTFWSGKRVFVTGQTGFKGGWLWLWLRHLGAEPTGFALPPETGPSLCTLAGIAADPASRHGDIRDGAAVAAAMREAEPDIVLHLAAQALVRRSYAEPAETFATNVMGTIHVLEAARRVPSCRAVVSVTTDKCYLNREWLWPYREDEALGGHDPYSASKACAEIATAAWRGSFMAKAGQQVATARAGNVVGGGDWSPDRLVPDCIRAMAAGEPVPIRNPAATRPWQHVLEPLAGYLVLAERLCGSGTEDGASVAEAWNFGPDMDDVQPVSTVVGHLVDLWGEGARWVQEGGPHPHEAGLLAVDAAKARARLGWRPRLPLREALGWTAAWHRRHLAGEDPRALVLDQIHAYERLGPVGRAPAPTEPGEVTA